MRTKALGVSAVLLMAASCPSMCENYFRKIKVETRGYFMAVIASCVGNLSQYQLHYHSVVGGSFSPAPIFGVFTQPVPFAASCDSVFGVSFGESRRHDRFCNVTLSA